MRGAEAIIRVVDGRVIKERIKKGYRIPELDEEIRKLRTRTEARLLSEARRCGVPTPRVFSVTEFSIEMEFVEGPTLKAVFSERFDPGLAVEVGRSAARLHTGGIIHGDLTTSNMILREGTVYFLDFGLGFFSSRCEDAATDLSVLFESVKSAHFKYLNEMWKNIISGYLEAGGSEEVLGKLEEIRKRARYVR